MKPKRTKICATKRLLSLLVVRTEESQNVTSNVLHLIVLTTKVTLLSPSDIFLLSIKFDVDVGSNINYLSYSTYGNQSTYVHTATFHFFRGKLTVCVVCTISWLCVKIRIFYFNLNLKNRCMDARNGYTFFSKPKKQKSTKLSNAVFFDWPKAKSLTTHNPETLSN